MSISERLVLFRESLNFDNSAKMAVELKIDSQNYYLYEKGRRGIPDDVYIKLRKVGCDLNWLITGDGTMSGEAKNVIQNHQVGNINGQQTINSSGDCKNCTTLEYFKEQNKNLTEMNKKLTDKLIEKI